MIQSQIIVTMNTIADPTKYSSQRWVNSNEDHKLYEANTNIRRSIPQRLNDKKKQ